MAGRVIARRLQSLHRATAVLLRAYSPMLLEEVLQLDPDRVWREEEPRVARLLEAGDAKSKVLYLVDERWLATWRAWAFWSPPKPSNGVPETKGGDPELPPSPPGPLLNSRLIGADRLKLCADYRAIGPPLYAYLVLCHGGDGVGRRLAPQDARAHRELRKVKEEGDAHPTHVAKQQLLTAGDRK